MEQRDNMNSRLLRALLFAVIFLLTACTDEFLSDMTKEEIQIIDTELSSPSGLRINEGMTDSVWMQLLALKGEAPELSKQQEPELLLENTRERVQKYTLSWSKVDDAEWYEIRSSREPITEDNWASAMRVDFFVMSESSGEITAQVPLTKAKVQSGKCITCGECVKACPFGAIETKNGKAVVDPDKCTRCGECWSSCKYDALDGFFAGSGFYFAIRSTNKSGNISASMSATSEPYELRYTTVASVPDDSKPSSWPAAARKGCFGNCGITYNENGECEHGSCYIVSPPNNVFDPGSHESVCPVDAIYSTEDSDDSSVTSGAIFIDKDKCINCGRCVLQCQSDGYGSVTSEIVKSVKRFLGR